MKVDSADQSQYAGKDPATLPQSPIGFDRFSIGMRNWLHWCEMDRAVICALLSRVWQVVAGPITIVLITNCFTSQAQGFYYTFASLLALQIFVELGFCVVIVNIASHEWSQLRTNAKGNIEGDPAALSRLVSLGHLVFKWYSIASVLFVIGVGAVGCVFFSHSDDAEVHWRGPWLAVVGLTGLLLWMLPFNSMLEGCNQVGTVNLFRFLQTLVGSLALWAALLLHWGLWAAVAAAAARLLANAYLLLVRYRHFFVPLFFRGPDGATMSWKNEIWPMQWRLGLSGVVNYFAFSLFTPVMFHYHGAAAAGRMGMTWQIVCSLQAVGMAWVTAKVPRFGMLIAQRQYESLDRLWARTLLVSLSAICLGAVVIWFLLYVLNVYHVSVAQRLLSPKTTTAFLFACVLMQIPQCQTAYLRAHRREPIVVMSVTTSLLIGLLVWVLGRRLGPSGAAAGYLVVAVLIVIWESMIWLHCRSNWHAPISSLTELE